MARRLQLRRLAVGLALLCILAVAGSISPLSGQPTVVSRRFAGTTLHFAAQPDVFAEPVRRLLPRFEQESGIKVVMETIPYAGLREKQLLDFTSRRATYDVVTMDIVWMGEYAEAGWIEPLARYINRDRAVVQWDDLLPGAIKGLATWKDQIYGMPLGAYYYLLHYRTDVFRQMNLKVPETLVEMRSVVRKLHDPPTRYGFTSGYARGAPLVHDSLAYLAGAGGSILKDFPRNYKPQMSSHIARTVYHFYKDMLNYAPPGALGFGFYARREPFHQGRVAIMGVWSSVSAAFEDPRQTVPTVIGNVGYSFMPKSNRAQRPVVPFGGWALVINRYTQKKDAAWEFIKWLTSPQIQRAYAADGGTPIRYSTLRDPELSAKNKWYRVILEAEAKGYVQYEFRPRIPEWPQMEEIMARHLSEAMAGSKTIERALNEIDAELEALLRKAGYPIRD
jgi:ABC-type glycerol-3-phosphate transport system substrate-binding protein